MYCQWLLVVGCLCLCVLLVRGRVLLLFAVVGWLFVFCVGVGFLCSFLLLVVAICCSCFDVSCPLLLCCYSLSLVVCFCRLLFVLFVGCCCCVFIGIRCWVLNVLGVRSCVLVCLFV